MLVVLGLGNPEPKYKNTRHNVGYMLKEIFDVPNVFINCPRDGMNNSGLTAKKLTTWKVGPRITRVDELLVVYDDFSLPLGQLRFRSVGSAGGHNGMGSIIKELGTDKVNRIKVGIGPPPDDNIVDFVLGDFTKDERIVINRALKKVILFLKHWTGFKVNSLLHEFLINSSDGEKSVYMNGLKV